MIEPNKRLNLAMELMCGHRGLVALGADELKVLGLWGKGAEEHGAFEALTGGPLEEHDFLAGIVADEMNMLRRSKASNKSSMTDTNLYKEGLTVTVSGNGETRSFPLDFGAVRIKSHTEDPKEDWLFICGRPTR